MWAYKYLEIILCKYIFLFYC